MPLIINVARSHQMCADYNDRFAGKSTRARLCSCTECCAGAIVRHL
jgi:hypothetical protein